MAATDRVFALPELLEAMLLYIEAAPRPRRWPIDAHDQEERGILDTFQLPIQLFTLQRVCRTFYATITRSRPLRQRMYEPFTYSDYIDLAGQLGTIENATEYARRQEQEGEGEGEESGGEDEASGEEEEVTEAENHERWARFHQERESDASGATLLGLVSPELETILETAPTKETLDARGTSWRQILLHRAPLRRTVQVYYYCKGGEEVVERQEDREGEDREGEGERPPEMVAWYYFELWKTKRETTFGDLADWLWEVSHRSEEENLVYSEQAGEWRYRHRRYPG